VLILGISGSFNTVDDQWAVGIPRGNSHDAAAVLVRDGVVVSAIEEERLTRIKHTHTFPLHAIRACLESARVDLGDVDQVAFFRGEEFLNRGVTGYLIHDPELEDTTARRRVVELLGDKVSGDQVAFVPHHTAHAASTYYESGFDRSAVLVMDGGGEYESVSLYVAEGDRLETVYQRPESASLGLMYWHFTRFLGYRLFDEYKVMGLAPFGDPQRYRALFESQYELGPAGEYSLKYRAFDRALLKAGIRPRRRHEPFSKDHLDFAAAAQETLERIVLHIAAGAAELTGQANLCLSGGVAQNCAANGKIATAGLFEQVFVHPASHDAGTALGAALVCANDQKPIVRNRRRTTALGSTIGSDDAVATELERWKRYLDFERCTSVADRAADLLASDQVVAWVQGRAEFGPRALGQRSILADPRPTGNRDRINSIIKQRESYRPFAPAVAAERAGEFFEIPDSAISADFMTFTVQVREEYRGVLGAITHTDGSARVQVVHRDASPLFWQLIDGFGSRTDIPIVLNTSFNNNYEPIVDSVADAIRCFLTMPLDYLIVGSIVVTRASWVDDLSELRPVLLPGVAAESRPREDGQMVHAVLEWAHRYDRGRVTPVSMSTCHMLTMADGSRTLADLSDAVGGAIVNDEWNLLWQRRLVDFRL
jgi:predicted NodU family carbamoyl transferase